MQTVLVLNAISHQHFVISISNLGHTHTHTTILWPVYYMSTCLTQHHQLRPGGFSCSKVLLSAHLC